MAEYWAEWQGPDGVGSTTGPTGFDNARDRLTAELTRVINNSTDSDRWQYRRAQREIERARGPLTETVLWHYWFTIGEIADRYGRPMPGDAVRLTSPWKWGLLETGKIGIIDGLLGHYPEDGHASVTFHAHTHRDYGVVSCSGGPATGWTDLTELRPTTDTVTVQAWRWRHGFRAAGEGVDYPVTVSVWEWTPKDCSPAW